MKIPFVAVFAEADRGRAAEALEWFFTPDLASLVVKAKEDAPLAISAPADVAADILDVSARAETAGDDPVLVFWSDAARQAKLVDAKRDMLVEALASNRLGFVQLDADLDLPLGYRAQPILDCAREPPSSAAIRSFLDPLFRGPAVELPAHGPDAPQAPITYRRLQVWQTIIAVIAALALAPLFFATMNQNAGTIGDPPPPSLLDQFGWLALIVVLGAAAALYFFRSHPLFARIFGRRAPADIPQQSSQPAVFISYARRDSARVNPIADDVEGLGYAVWIDKTGMHGGGSWPGQIVAAIRASKVQMVMCSSAAFSSDDVAREVLLANHFKKPMLPVFLEEADPPDDLLYFLVRPQQIRLAGLDETARRQALSKALAAIA